MRNWAWIPMCHGGVGVWKDGEGTGIENPVRKPEAKLCKNRLAFSTSWNFLSEVILLGFWVRKSLQSWGGGKRGVFGHENWVRSLSHEAHPPLHHPKPGKSAGITYTLRTNQGTLVGRIFRHISLCWENLGDGYGCQQGWRNKQKGAESPRTSRQGWLGPDFGRSYRSVHVSQNSPSPYFSATVRLGNCVTRHGVGGKSP